MGFHHLSELFDKYLRLLCATRLAMFPCCLLKEELMFRQYSPDSHCKQTGTRFRTLSKIVLPIQSELHSNFGYAPRSALSLDPEGLVYHIRSSQFELQKQNHQTQVCRRHAFI